MEPTEHGYEKVAEKGPLTKYVKDGRNGRIVLYHTPERAVRVNEGARTPNVVETSPDFFWRDSIHSGKLIDNQRAETPEQAHEVAQERIEELLT
jgi:hypothetical protein